MGTIRCILFLTNEEAKELGSVSKKVFDSPQAVYGVMDGLSPISPADIKRFWNLFDLDEGTAIVEIMCSPDAKSTVSEINREDIISVNLNKGGGLFYPYRMFKPYCMFSKDTNVFKDELGWSHPMPGISWLRNKQCMSETAYNKMLETLADSDKPCITRYVEDLFIGSLMDQELIDKYHL